MSEKPEALRLADEFEHGCPLAEDMKDAAVELRRLHAECEALRADAGRYRLLRRGQHWSVINGIGDTLRADQLDAAIDTAMAKEQTK